MEKKKTERIKKNDKGKEARALDEHTVGI